MAFSPLRLMPTAPAVRADDGDAALLTRFVEKRDESAFAGLLCRHGPLVWGVCRRSLANAADAEDAFQATFLVLFQRAHRIGKRTSLASWLHGVAWRVARRVRARHARRREVVMIPTLALAKVVAAEEGIAYVLDAEVRKLPARYREPVILCHLHGHSHAAAAQALGWPIGTVAGRLSRARELLRSRLLRRGIPPALAATWCGEAASTPLPATLIQNTLHALATGPAAAIVQLAKGVMVTMWITRSLLVGVVALGITLVLGAGYQAYAVWGGQDDKEKAAPAKSEPAKPLHPDYQLLQGQWRHENRNRVTDELIWVEDLFFRGAEYVRRRYQIVNGVPAGVTESNQPTRFELHPEHAPKRIDLRLKYVDEMMEKGPKFHPGPPYDKPPDQPIIDAVELDLYIVDGDELRIQPGGFASLKRRADGNYYIDRDEPTATYPKAFGDRIKIYRRMTPAAAKDKPTKVAAPSIAEKKLLDQLIEASEETCLLRRQAYRAGKESVDFLLQSFRDRVNAKLQRDGADPAKKRAVLQEAFDALSETEKIVEAKHAAGSTTRLEVVIVKQERLEYELKLLRLGN